MVNRVTAGVCLTCILGSPAASTSTERAFSHLTVGGGSPVTEHENIAVVPTRSSWEGGMAWAIGIAVYYDTDLVVQNRISLGACW